MRFVNAQSSFAEMLEICAVMMIDIYAGSNDEYLHENNSKNNMRNHKMATHRCGCGGMMNIWLQTKGHIYRAEIIWLVDGV